MATAISTLSANAQAMRNAELHDAGVHVLTGDAYAAMLAACYAIETELDIDAAIAELRAAGFSDPSRVPAPSNTQAIDYARGCLPTTAIVCGCVANDTNEYAGMRDVLFQLTGERSARVVRRLTVWMEPVTGGAGYAPYGEW